MYELQRSIAAAGSDAMAPAVLAASSQFASVPSGTNTADRTTIAHAPTRLTATEMERISHFPTPAEVFAVGRIVRPALTAGLLNRGLTLALDDVQDAGNVGTILRLADWFGFDRVLLSPGCADAFSQTTATSVQMHGGIAFTWAHPAHLYLRRARAGAQLFGASAQHRERFLTELGA